MNINLLVNSSYVIPLDSKPGYVEDAFLRQFVKVEDLEPKAKACTKVYGQNQIVTFTCTENLFNFLVIKKLCIIIIIITTPVRCISYIPHKIISHIHIAFFYCFVQWTLILLLPSPCRCMYGIRGQRNRLCFTKTSWSEWAILPIETLKCDQHTCIIS